MAVEFDEPKYSYDRKESAEVPSGNSPIIKLLSKIGIKSRTGANLVMIVICIICLLLAFYFISTAL